MLFPPVEGDYRYGDGGYGGYGGGSGGYGGGGGGGPAPTFGSNQWFPVLPTLNTPPSTYQLPSGSSVPFAGFGPSGGSSLPTYGGASGTEYKPKLQSLGKEGYYTVTPINPALTGAFGSYLQSQIGKGSQPFPGELTAPLNDLLRMYQSFYQTGQTVLPGLSTMQKMSQTGMPVSADPVWQSMIAAMQRQIDQGAASLRGQFAFTGGLASSPFGTAAADYQLQAAKDKESLISQLTYQSQEAARERQMKAGTFLAQTGRDLSGYLQGLDQEALDRLYNEFIRTRPEYNPLLQYMYGMSTSFPPVITKKFGIGAAGAALQGAGSIASAIADIFKKDNTSQLPTFSF